MEERCKERNKKRKSKKRRNKRNKDRKKERAHSVTNIRSFNIRSFLRSLPP